MPRKLPSGPIELTRFGRLSTVLPILLDASADANPAVGDRWQFAVKAAELYSLGAKLLDVRWAIIEGLFEHGLEKSQRRNKRRFASSIGPVICENSCFLLSSEGIDLARRVLNGSRSKHKSRVLRSTKTRPRWDALMRELTLQGRVVKRFRRPADAQETVLSAFEEEGWPKRILDPLDKVAGVDRKDRLHNTIKRLNGSQLEAIITFFRDGTGAGLRWEIGAEVD